MAVFRNAAEASLLMEWYGQWVFRANNQTRQVIKAQVIPQYVNYVKKTQFNAITISGIITKNCGQSQSGEGWQSFVDFFSLAKPSNDSAWLMFVIYYLSQSVCFSTLPLKTSKIGNP